MSEYSVDHPEDRWALGVEIAYEENQAKLQAQGVGEEAELAEGLLDHLSVLVGTLIGRKVPGSEQFSDIWLNRQSKVETQPSFNAKLSTYLNGQETLSLTEQLDTIGEFWSMLGYSVPALSSRQEVRLAEAVAAHPNRRLLPVPSMDLEDRIAVFERAQTGLENNKFGSDKSRPLWVPTTGLYNRLLQNPMGQVDEEGVKYGLGYKLPDGSIVNRETFYWYLDIHEQLVADKQGNEWTFPVLDVQVNTARTSYPGIESYQKVDPIITPEVLLAMQLVHQANGRPNIRQRVDIANEAVYKLGDSSQFEELASETGIWWNNAKHAKQVMLIAYPSRGTDRERKVYDVRAGESGLKA